MGDMNAELIIAAFVVTWAGLAFAFGFIVKILQDIGGLKIQFQTLVNLLGDKIARVLHSPHSPTLDKFLEKIYENGPLNRSEYDELMGILQNVQNATGDSERPKEEKLMAAMLEVALKHDARYAEFQ